MWHTLQKEYGFLAPSLLLFLLGGMVLWSFDHGFGVLWFNAHRSYAAHVFFKYFTYVGDGWFYVALIILLGIWRPKLALTALLCFLAAGLGAQFFKKVIFYEYLRPTAYFGDTVTWNLVEGVKMHTRFSFPSGHTATASSAFYLLSRLSSQQAWKFLCFLMALLAGLSRVYLAQHFLIDIYFGALWGLVSCALIISLRKTSLPYN